MTYLCWAQVPMLGTGSPGLISKEEAISSEVAFFVWNL